MKQPQRSPRSQQRGVSIVELMVCLFIGMIVIGAVLVSYLGSGQTGTQQAAYSQMNDDAQIGLSIVARDLMLAGYARPTGVGAASGRFAGTPASAIFGCDKGFVTPNKLGQLVAASDCAASGSSSALEVIYEADLANTVANSTNPSDCIGNTIDQFLHPLVPASWLRNRYYIANSSYTGTARPELHCASNVPGSTGAAVPGQPLVENVEAMRVTYLEALLPLKSTALDDQRYRYVAASGVVDWGNVLAVRVCLLMRSAEPVVTPEDASAIKSGYLDCELNTVSSPDRYLRRAYFTTVALRNKIPF